jgi:hypothetical protein
MSFALSLFAAVAVQKNVRDLATFESLNPISKNIEPEDSSSRLEKLSDAFRKKE